MSNLYLLKNIAYGYSTEFLLFLTIIPIILGIFTIITKNPIISVLYLILLFSSISCYLILIGVNFIGISYLLVYVGAVSILFLFILMLINIRVSELINDTSNNTPLAIIAIIIFFIPFNLLLPDKSELNNTNKDIILYATSNNWDNHITDTIDIMSIGNIMYTSYSIWLLITSIILLLSMVGSIVITIKQTY
jgi:NADH-ubiquinone oxidoreductase chain 6